MFLESHRVLRTTNHGDTIGGNGIMLIITMAENHSLDLILSNWLSSSSQSQLGDDCRNHEKYYWNRSLHIHELIPTSGKMRPFCFVLQKSNEIEIECNMQYGGTNNWKIIFHPVSDSTDLSDAQSNVISIPINEDSVDSPQLLPTETPSTPITSPSFSIVKDQVDDLLKVSRSKFLEETQQENNNVKSSAAGKRMILGIIEIKPASHTVNLKQLHDRITAPTNEWGIESLQWCDDGMITDNAERTTVDNTSSDTDLCYGKIVPIGFGIKKLVLRCLIDSDLLEDICEAIMKYEGKRTNSENDGEEEEDDCIQSIDVDWENSFTVGDLGNILPQK